MRVSEDINELCRKKLEDEENRMTIMPYDSDEKEMEGEFDALEFGLETHAPST